MKIFLQGYRVIVELENGDRIVRQPGGIIFSRFGDYFLIEDTQITGRGWQVLYSDITDEAGTPQASADLTEAYLELNIFPA